jgi:signal transduction histidine kinase
LSRPIRAMERATRHIAAGDLDVRVGNCGGDVYPRDMYPEDELGRLAASINHMAERLKHLETARTRFVSEIAHDLRTPLTAIKGLVVNLVDVAGPGERPSLEIAEQETDRLIRLVNQLLDFSRWQAGRLELNPALLDVGAIARDAVTLSQGRARHRGVTLSMDIAPDLPPLSADPDRLSQVILNLLDNAIKFTPGGGQVTLEVTHSQDHLVSMSKGDTLSLSKGSTLNSPKGSTLSLSKGSTLSLSKGSTLSSSKGEVTISVQDTGRGMEKAEQAQAFEAYYRGPGGGSGLGLAIARAIVEAHGGRMGLESSPGQGSRVWFTLPCNNCS